MSTRPRVVIVGGGFGGLSAARALSREEVDVTLIDRTNHFLFQPLLYQVATGLLSPADIAVPTRFLVRKQQNTTVLLGEVISIDLQRRVVIADEGRLALEYDYLIVAPGARHSYFGHPEWESMAPGLKTLDDARRIRRRFLLALEEAEKSDDRAKQDALMTFVIVGGGPTGVELAGVLPSMAQKGFRRDFRRIDSRRVRVVLLEGGPRLLPTFPERLSARAKRDLEQLGVQVRTGAMVTRVRPDGVDLGDEHIPSRTVFWAAGNAASPLIQAMGVAVDPAGRALVSADLSLPGRPEVFVIGDAAAVVSHQSPVDSRQSVVSSPAVAAGVAAREGGSSVDSRRLSAEPATAAAERPQYVPGLAAAANQMGEHAARMIVRTLENQPRRPFKYRDRGSMAVIGRGRALAVIGRITLTGIVAFYTWLFVHLLYLAGGFRNRASVMLEWAYAYVTYRPGARLITADDVRASIEEQPYESERPQARA